MNNSFFLYKKIENIVRWNGASHLTPQRYELWILKLLGAFYKMTTENRASIFHFFPIWVRKSEIIIKKILHHINVLNFKNFNLLNSEWLLRLYLKKPLCGETCHVFKHKVNIFELNWVLFHSICEFCLPSTCFLS